MDRSSIPEALAAQGVPLAAGGGGSFASALQDLEDELDLNIELAEPGQVLPVPRGREARTTFHGRYGAVDVFLDDPYAIALSKLSRGTEQDLADVRLMAEAKLLAYADLEAKAREIADPANPRALQVRLEAMLARLERARRAGGA